MKYKNPNYKKIRGSHILIVSCGNCKTDIAKYQKLGRGNLLRMHIERIIKCSLDYPKQLICPNCGKHLASKISIKKSGKESYKMNRSTYNVREDNE